MVYSVENAGFSRGGERSVVGAATAKRMGLDAKKAEKAAYLAHFAKNLSLCHHICHLTTHCLPVV